MVDAWAGGVTRESSQSVLAAATAVELLATKAAGQQIR